MPEVAIIGAGEIGGAVARALAARGRVAAIALIDANEAVARGKALDLNQAAPVRGIDTPIEAHSDLAAACGARVIVMADAAAGGEWSGEAGLSMLKRLATFGALDAAVLICAGAGHGLMMQQAFDELRLARRRTAGAAPEAMAAIARSLVAIEAGAAGGQVALTLVGRPPGRFVVPWSQASVAGTAVTSLLNAAALARIERRMNGLWPPGPGALGTSAALLAEAAATGSRRLFSAFVSLDRDNGTRAPVCAWPVALGPAGLERVAPLELAGRERVVVDEVLQ